METWKNIKGYEGIYQISNKGRVKSLHNKKEKILKSKPNKAGYLIVGLCKNGIPNYFYIHRLVAEAFLSNFDNLPEVNHKDENKLNNNVENLEWCDRKYNNNYGTRNEKVSKKVICVETQEIFISCRDVINRMFHGNGCFDMISKCCTGKRKSAYGYHFKYIDE